MQAVEVAQETSSSWPSVDPAGLGTEAIDQVVPFQRSENVCVPLEDLVPTAVQEVDIGQETASSLPSLPSPPLGLGVVWIVHEVPFQRIAKGTWVASDSE
jgi:hypothetical protein